MPEVFLIKNQYGYFLAKSGEFVHPKELKSLYRTAFKDEAINQKVEFAVKDADLRLKVIDCMTDEKGVPALDDHYFDTASAATETEHAAGQATDANQPPANFTDDTGAFAYSALMEQAQQTPASPASTSNQDELF